METGKFGVSGLVSGINSAEIIDALVQVDKGATRLVENQRTRYGARLEAVRSLNTRVLSAQVDLVNLKRAATFNGRIATSSDEAVVSATATSSAAAGSYSFEILGLAKAHQVATAAQMSSSGNLGTGTITLQVGSGPIASINIGSGNTGLQNIAKSINDAKAGVVASVVNDGTGYRLVIQAQATGENEVISISAVDDNSGDGVDLADVFTGSTTIQAAASAQLQLGSGGSAITVAYATNTVTDFIPGVSLNLSKISTGPVTVVVGNDSSAAKTAISAFVESFNSAYSYLKENGSYDTVTKEGGILIGESGLKASMSKVISLMTRADPSLPSSLSTLSSIGISLDKATGGLVIDEAKLDAQLASNPEGVSKLFTNSGTSADPSVNFSFLGKNTTAGSYQIAVTQAAAQAKVGTVGDIIADGGGLVAINGTNKTLELTVNGQAVTASLAEGSYTRIQLAEQLQTAINAQTTGGHKVLVTLDGNQVDIRTTGFGSSQSIQVTGGTAATLLQVSGSLSHGLNVEGTIGGIAAVGVGQVLTAGAGSPAQGLGLVIKSTVPLTTTMTVRKGMAQGIEEALGGMTDPESGSIVSKENAFEAVIENMNKRIDKMNLLSDQRRVRYEAKFLAMEKLIASMKSQENLLNGQISGFENASRARANG